MIWYESNNSLLYDISCYKEVTDNVQDMEEDNVERDLQEEVPVDSEQVI